MVNFAEKRNVEHKIALVIDASYSGDECYDLFQLLGNWSKLKAIEH